MRGRWLFGVVGVAVLVAVLIWVIGVGADGSGEPPFTATDSQVKTECLTGTYVPSEPAGLKLEEEPVPRSMEGIENAPGAIQPDRSAVEVTLRPKEPGEEVTLEGFHLDVTPRPLRPLGVTFFRPCERKVVGPAIEVDLDTYGSVQASSADLEGTMGTGLQLPDSAEPIKYPWTITLDKPITLYVVAHGEHCYCVWSARIPWSSGSSDGVIHVDNGGKRYVETDTVGTFWDRPVNGRWVRGAAPTWTGD